jgi:hypothetical protein
MTIEIDRVQSVVRRELRELHRNADKVRLRVFIARADILADWLHMQRVWRSAREGLEAAASRVKAWAHSRDRHSPAPPKS